VLLQSFPAFWDVDLPDRTYELMREDDNENLTPATIADVRAAILGAGYAWVHAESYEWSQPAENGVCTGHSVKRLHPDKIRLSLSRWDGKDYDWTTAFVLVGAD
jgi:hypothetical protein